jgi:hypothetical protein
MQMYLGRMEMSDLYRLGGRPAEIALEDVGADELGLAHGEFLVLRTRWVHRPVRTSPAVPQSRTRSPQAA